MEKYAVDFSDSGEHSIADKTVMVKKWPSTESKELKQNQQLNTNYDLIVIHTNSDGFHW